MLFAKCCVLFCIISIPGLDNQILLFGHQADLVIAGFSGAFVWRVSQVVLRPQFLGDAVINLINRLLFGDFVQTPACFPRNLIQNFLAVHARFLRRPSAPAASAATARPSSTRKAAAGEADVRSTGTAETIVLILISKQDGVNHGVGTLRRLNRALQRLPAAPVVSVGKNNQ